jgi:hypothetical protein
MLLRIGRALSQYQLAHDCRLHPLNPLHTRLLALAQFSPAPLKVRKILSRKLLLIDNDKLVMLGPISYVTIAFFLSASN